MVPGQQGCKRYRAVWYKCPERGHPLLTVWNQHRKRISPQRYVLYLGIEFVTKRVRNQISNKNQSRNRGKMPSPHQIFEKNNFITRQRWTRRSRANYFYSVGWSPFFKLSAKKFCKHECFCLNVLFLSVATLITTSQFEQSFVLLHPCSNDVTVDNKIIQSFPILLPAVRPCIPWKVRLHWLIFKDFEKTSWPHEKRAKPNTRPSLKFTE